MISRGKHKIGFGASFTLSHWRVLPVIINTAGLLSPQTLDAFYQGGLDPATPTVDFTSLTQSFTSMKSVPLSFLNFGVYGQEGWHASPNLTLTIALRAEHYSECCV